MGKYHDIDINNEKVKKIVNAAFEEFAKYGSDKASLNKILKSSGISKGVFYHYFEDKDELFGFLNHYAYDFVFKSYSQKINLNEDDIIKRICDISKLKLEIIRDHPYMIEFYEKFSTHIMKNVDQDYINDWRGKFYSQNITFDKLRDPSKAKEVIHIAKWTYKGLFMDLLSNHKSPNESETKELTRQCDIYYDVLVQNLYK